MSQTPDLGENMDSLIDAAAAGSESAASVGLQYDESSDEEIFMGPLSDREKARSRKMRRRTQVYKLGFREGLEEEEGTEDEDVEQFADVQLSIRDTDTAHSASLEMSASASPVQSPTALSIAIQSPVPGEVLSREDSCMEDHRDYQPSRIPRLHDGALTPQPMTAESSVATAAVDLETPILSLVAVSPQSQLGRDSEVSRVELFSATEGPCALISDDTGSSFDMVESGSQTAMNSLESSQCSLSVHEPGGNEENNGPPMDLLSTNKQSSTEQSRKVTDTGRGTPNNRRPGSEGHTVLYSSPLLTTTNVQAIQSQQPLCFGHLLDSEDMVSHSSYSGATMSPVVGGLTTRSSFNTLQSAFSKPSNGTCQQPGLPQVVSQPGHRQVVSHPVHQQVVSHPVHQQVVSHPVQQEVVSSQKGPQHVASRTALSSAYQSPVMSLGRAHSVMGVGGSPAFIPTALVSPSPRVMKENRHPNPFPPSRQPAPVHDGMPAAPSPRILQVRTTQPGVESPSVARQRLIEEKRAMLARLRADKEELRQRIRQDNEKCFNMKMANATALRGNMAEGMTPLVEREPPQDCSGIASLRLNDHELDIVTKLHTIRNGQHAPSSTTNSPCHIQRVPVRLHWCQDLIMAVEQLSSPSRPRGKARPILSKKSHQTRGSPSAMMVSSTRQTGVPRACQHLVF